MNSRPRYVCKLSKNLIRSAIKEVNEPPKNERRLKSIDKVLRKYDAKTYGPLHNTSDEFVLRFLRARDFDCKDALELLHSYQEARLKYYEDFEKMTDVEEMERVGRKGVIYILDGNAKNGAAVMVYRPSVLENSDVSAAAGFGVLVIEKLLENEYNQIFGLVIIQDMREVNIGLMTKVSPFRLGKMFSLWTNCLPVRLRAVHLINEGGSFRFCFWFIKRSLTEDMLDIIHSHKSDYIQLQDYIKPSVLPDDLCGTGGSYRELLEGLLGHLLFDYGETDAESDHY